MMFIEKTMTFRNTISSPNTSGPISYLMEPAVLSVRRQWFVEIDIYYEETCI